MFLLQTPPNWEKAEDLGLIKSELVAILFALAAILFAAAWVLSWMHEREEKKKLEANNNNTSNNS
jgi:hypothetical protein